MFTLHPRKHAAVDHESRRFRSRPNVNVLAVEEYTGHTPGSIYAELGFRAPEL